MSNDKDLEKIYNSELEKFCNIFKCTPSNINFSDKYFLQTISEMKLEILELNNFKNSILKIAVGYYEKFGDRHV